VVSVHELGYRLYGHIPPSFKPIVLDVYGQVERFGYQRDFVSQFFDNRAEYKRYEREYTRSAIPGEIEAAQQAHHRRTGHEMFAGLNRFTPSRLYALVRKRQPETVLETGVCNGVSTLIVLRALQRNGTGKLHSVDLPDVKRLPDGAKPGWIVPDELRSSWTLTIGDSLEELPAVVQELDDIDLFIHDTKSTILDDELETVWSKLPKGAPILADDIHTNSMFESVLNIFDVDSGHVAPNIAYFVKR